jgi:uncharacterized protein
VRVGTGTASRRAVTSVVCGLALALLTVPCHSQDLPSLTHPVNDFANVVDGPSERRLDELIRTVETRTGDVIIVVTIDTVAPYATPRDYAVKLFANRGRGIGQKSQDNGVLVLLALKERRVEMEVGYGLEPYITDAFSGEVSRSMTPYFRRGEYGQGLVSGVTRIVGRIAEARGVDFENLPTASPEERSVRVNPGSLNVLLFIGFIALMQLLSIINRFRTRRRRRWGRPRTWSGWHSGVGPFGGGIGGLGGGFGGGFGGFGGGGGGFGGFGGGRSGGGGGGASW